METVVQQKAMLRKQIRTARQKQNPAALQNDSAAICSRLLSLPELQTAETVFCYLSCRGEVDTHRLTEELLKMGKRVLVPRCRELGQMDCVCIRSLLDLHAGKFGILEPPSSFPAVKPEEIDFAVIPAVACGQDGSRLGQGGGYYDRFLERFPGSFAALCQKRFLLPSVPCESHDRKMKIIVTPQRVLRFEEL